MSGPRAAARRRPGLGRLAPLVALVAAVPAASGLEEFLASEDGSWGLTNDGRPCDCSSYCAGAEAATYKQRPVPQPSPQMQGPAPPAKFVRPGGRFRAFLARTEELSEQQPSVFNEEPGMHCNCHCAIDPWVWMRTGKPTIDWSATPPPPDPTPPGAPCSGTNQEWPSCGANMQEYGPVKGTGGLKGLPALPPVGANDLLPPQAHIVPTDHPFPDNIIPAEPQPPPDIAPPGSPEAVAAAEEAKPEPTKDCVDAHLNRIPCPEDPQMEGGWWGPPLDPSEVFYVSKGDVQSR